MPAYTAKNYKLTRNLFNEQVEACSSIVGSEMLQNKPHPSK